VIWVFKAAKISESDPQHQMPLPQHSARKKAFWRQEPVLGLGGIPTHNILLLWSEEQGSYIPQ
jgi:hypothetical protein